MGEVIETLFVACLLCSGMHEFTGDEYPKVGCQQAAFSLPQWAKEFVVEYAARCGLARPADEAYWWQGFDGVYSVLWRRGQGRPFSYPTDPTFGAKPAKEFD